MFCKMYFLYDFQCAQTRSFRAVFAQPVRNLTLAVSAYVATCGEKICRCTSTFSVINYSKVFFFKSLSYLCEVVHTLFRRFFWTFRIFDRNFAKIVAPPSVENENYFVHLKEQSLLKNVNAMPASAMSPSNERRSGLVSKKKNKQTNTTFSHLQPARTVRSSSNFAW